jgi:regulator of RNase E activity RraA
MKVSDYQALAAFDRVTPDQVAQAARYPVAVVGDMAGRRGAMNARIQALGPGMKLAGPAFTVECRPGDNLMVHVAAAIARPGDILVVDARNDQTCALIGELLVAQLRAAGVAGAVTDSAVRDTAELAHGPMPIFASGRNPCGPTKNVPGRLGIPISCGGAPVSPGDLVLGDEDGVMVIPRAEVPGVLGQLDAKMAAEAQRLKEISEGRLISPWVDEAMRAAGILDAGESLIAAFDGRR